MKPKRDLTSLLDLSKSEILEILNLTTQMKNDPTHSMELLKGKTIGLLFQKPSLRTRVSFEVGIDRMGGNCIYLGSEEINLGVREPTADAAQTLSRYLDGIVARTFKHKDVSELAQKSNIPVINGLSDLYHPCQALTDLFSIKEKFNDLNGLTLAYIGDGNNVCHSLMLACSKIGMHMKIANPKGYEPSELIYPHVKSYTQETGAQISLLEDPAKAVTNAHIIYADVWVSMGDESQSEKRLNDFQGFQINAELAKLADPNYIFMHCLPAHRGEEVTAEIIDGEHSIVFDQAENRLHTQKAILNFLFHTW